MLTPLLGCNAGGLGVRDALKPPPLPLTSHRPLMQGTHCQAGLPNAQLLRLCPSPSGVAVGSNPPKSFSEFITRTTTGGICVVLQASDRGLSWQSLL